MAKKYKDRNYTKEEVKEMFKSYRAKGDMYITDREYNILCSAISNLPKDIVDKISEEVYFIALSLRKNRKIWPACYQNLESKDLENKKGIIFLSPLIFKSRNEILYPTYPILHEIAHHILRHKDVKNIEERKKFEKEAEKLAMKWLIGEFKTQSKN